MQAARGQGLQQFCFRPRQLEPGHPICPLQNHYLPVKWGHVSPYGTPRRQSARLRHTARSRITNCRHRRRSFQVGSDQIRWSTSLMPRSCRCSRSRPPCPGGVLQRNVAAPSNIVPRCAPNSRAPHSLLASHARSRFGGDLPPGSRIRPDRTVEFHRHGRAGRHDRGRAVRAPADSRRLVFSL